MSTPTIKQDNPEKLARHDDYFVKEKENKNKSKMNKNISVL